MTKMYVLLQNSNKYIELSCKNFKPNLTFRERITNFKGNWLVTKCDIDGLDCYKDKCKIMKDRAKYLDHSFKISECIESIYDQIIIDNKSPTEKQKEAIDSIWKNKKMDNWYTQFKNGYYDSFTWDSISKHVDLSNIKDYDAEKEYTEGNVINHPIDGLAIVVSGQIIQPDISSNQFAKYP